MDVLFLPLLLLSAAGATETPGNGGATATAVARARIVSAATVRRADARTLPIDRPDRSTLVASAGQVQIDKNTRLSVTEYH